MTEETIKIIAEDGYTLFGTLREPKLSTDIKGYIQINSGTGIPEKFYRHFAKYLTQQGYVTVTFDYRGIGKSKPKKLRGFDATNFQWGTLDMTAVLNWGIEHYPDIDKIIIGHSMGGQLIGTMKNAEKIDRTIIIASGTGFWKDMPKSRLKFLMPFLWYVYIPLTSFVCGYGGAKKIKQGENLPKGVALQWRKWCVNDDYWESDFNKETNANSFSKLNGKLKSISFTDDNIISAKANKKLLNYFKNVSIENKVIAPNDFNLTQIGHFGFFSKKSEKLWKYTLE